MWAEERRGTARGKDRVRIRDLFADERCGRPILDFQRTLERNARWDLMGREKRPRARARSRKAKRGRRTEAYLERWRSRGRGHKVWSCFSYFSFLPSFEVEIGQAARHLRTVRRLQPRSFD